MLPSQPHQTATTSDSFDPFVAPRRYPIPLGPLASGDSARSRRVRELLSGEEHGITKRMPSTAADMATTASTTASAAATAPMAVDATATAIVTSTLLRVSPPLTPARIHDIHFDTTAVVPRDVARLAGAAGAQITSAAARALLPWLAQWLSDTGGDIATKSSVAAVGWALADTSLRWHGKAIAPLALRFGEGDNGLQYMLRNTTNELPHCCTPGLVPWLTQQLDIANATLAKVGPGPGAAWTAWVDQQQSIALPLWQEALGSKLSFDPDGTTVVKASGLVDMFKQTVLAQGGQCYSQTVLLGDAPAGELPGGAGAAPAALSVLPFGEQEELGLPHFDDQLGLWREAARGMKPATFF